MIVLHVNTDNCDWSWTEILANIAYILVANKWIHKSPCFDWLIDSKKSQRWCRSCSSWIITYIKFRRSLWIFGKKNLYLEGVQSVSFCDRFKSDRPGDFYDQTWDRTRLDTYSRPRIGKNQTSHLVYRNVRTWVVTFCGAVQDFH